MNINTVIWFKAFKRVYTKSPLLSPFHLDALQRQPLLPMSSEYASIRYENMYLYDLSFKTQKVMPYTHFCTLPCSLEDWFLERNMIGFIAM